MKSILLTGHRQMAMANSPSPKITGDTDVLFRVDAVGVCGSDVHYYRTGRIGDQVVTFPFILGHECAGTVVEVGTAVTNVKPGDRIAVDPALSCGACDQCRAGRPHTCRHLKFMACPGQLDGCLSEYYVIPAHCCFQVQPDTDPGIAALVEPLSIGVYAVQTGKLSPGQSICIFGMGPIGLSVMVAARALGVERIACVEPLDYRREIACAHGAQTGCDPGTDNPTDVLGRIFDVVFDCCGEQAALDSGCTLVQSGGLLVIVGIPETDRIAFNPHILRRNEITICNVRRQNGCMPATIDFIERSGIDARFMITHWFPLEETQTAFDLVDQYHDRVIKPMIRP